MRPPKKNLKDYRLAQMPPEKRAVILAFRMKQAIRRYEAANKEKHSPSTYEK